MASPIRFPAPGLLRRILRSRPDLPERLQPECGSWIQFGSERSDAHRRTHHVRAEYALGVRLVRLCNQQCLSVCERRDRQPLVVVLGTKLALGFPGDWAPVWLRAGVTGFWGAVTDPTLLDSPRATISSNHFWAGYNFAESAYIANPLLNHAMVFVGDPLYAPRLFGYWLSPQQVSTIAAGGAYAAKLALEPNSPGPR